MVGRVLARLRGPGTRPPRPGEGDDRRGPELGQLIEHGCHLCVGFLGEAQAAEPTAPIAEGETAAA